MRKGASMPRVPYKTSWGARVPGVTTISGMLDKPFLKVWANNIGLQGIKMKEYVDDKASIGTLAHQMVQDYFEENETEFLNYTNEQIDLAENALLSFWEWEKENDIEIIEMETHMVSDEMLYGGTIDCYCMLNGRKTLLDFKTSKAVYKDYFVQVSAYKALLEEQGKEVEDVAILRIGRDETEGFEIIYVEHTDTYFKIFKNLLEIYQMKKELAWR
jgi:hypothetical protein